MSHPTAPVVVADPVVAVSPWDGWYKKPWGIGLIVIGVLGVGYFMFSPKKAAA
jgi:hypothetical protein